MFRIRSLLQVLLLMYSVPGMVLADPGQASVQAFFGDLQTLQADFDQQVVDSNDQTVQSSRGHMWIKRPGRFRWDYQLPYRQQIVADGTRLWSYDEDLEQVTVQPAGEVLTATPAMLLSGDRPLGEVFVIAELPAIDDSIRVRLTPKSDDSNITSLQLYFRSDTLVRIVASDSFGNTTSFTFTNVQRNPELSDMLFRFVPPDGADIIGDAG